MSVTSALISGGASILGGLLGRKSDQRASTKAIRQQIAGSKETLEHQYATQQKYIPQNIVAKVQGAKQAGLHPLAALGIAPAGTPATGAMPIVPGQSDTGSIIGRGIEAAGRGYQRGQEMEYAKKIAELDLENRKLQNEFLMAQIDSSRKKTLESQVISYPEAYRRLRLTRDPVQTALQAKATKATPVVTDPWDSIPKAHKDPRFMVTSDGDIIEIPPGTPQSVLEDEIGDWSNLMPDTVKRAAEVFKAQGYKALKRFIEGEIERQKDILMRFVPDFSADLPPNTHQKYWEKR